MKKQTLYLCAIGLGVSASCIFSPLASAQPALPIRDFSQLSIVSRSVMTLEGSVTRDNEGQNPFVRRVLLVNPTLGCLIGTSWTNFERDPNSPSTDPSDLRPTACAPIPAAILSALTPENLGSRTDAENQTTLGALVAHYRSCNRTEAGYWAGARVLREKGAISGRYQWGTHPAAVRTEMRFYPTPTLVITAMAQGTDVRCITPGNGFLNRFALTLFDRR